MTRPIIIMRHTDAQCELLQYMKYQWVGAAIGRPNNAQYLYHTKQSKYKVAASMLLLSLRGSVHHITKHSRKGSSALGRSRSWFKE